MAKVTITEPSEFMAKLSKLETSHKKIAGKAIFAGAKIIADQISSNLSTIPVEPFRYLHDGEQLSSASASQVEGLMNCFGITTLQEDEDGYNVKCGFSEYIDTNIIPPTNQYPRGLPAPMLARAIESGSSFRKKHPFVRPAIAQTKGKAKEKMAQIIEEETKKIMD